MDNIRYVQPIDYSFWFSLDKHISETEFKNKIRDKMGYVILHDTIPIGILRYNLFWDTIPFCTMLYINEESQHKGYGKKLIEFWERDMESLGYGIVMTSTLVTEETQHFYRKLGYKDSGDLLMDMLHTNNQWKSFLRKPSN